MTVKFDDVAITRRIHFAARAGIREATEELAENVRKVLRTGVKHGKQYKQNPRRSSAPGEPPARQTGELHNSVTSHVTGRGSTLIGHVTVRDPKAADLEFGTDHSTPHGYRILPRPFLRPVAAKAGRRYRETISKRIRINMV